MPASQFVDHRVGVAARCDTTMPDNTAKTSQGSVRFRLPDPPQHKPDEITQYDHPFKTGNSRYLALSASDLHCAARS